MARQTSLAVRDERFLLLWREWVAAETGNILHTRAVYFPILMAAEARILLRPEGMHPLAVAILAGQFLAEHVPGMASRLIHHHRSPPLRRLIPVTFHAHRPRRRVAVRLRRLPVRRKNKLDEQPVLLDEPELMTGLAHDAMVAGELPRRVSFLHEMTAVAELGILLDIVVIADTKNNPQGRDDEHEGHNDRLFPRA